MWEVSPRFSTIMWPVFSSKWQRSRKKADVQGLYPSLVPGMDSLPRYALSGGLTATLWVKPSPGVVPHSKERRRGAARLCLKNLPFYG